MRVSGYSVSFSIRTRGVGREVREVGLCRHPISICSSVQLELTSVIFVLAGKSTIAKPFSIGRERDLVTLTVSKDLTRWGISHTYDRVCRFRDVSSSPDQTTPLRLPQKRRTVWPNGSVWSGISVLVGTISLVVTGLTSSPGRLFCDLTMTALIVLVVMFSDFTDFSISIFTEQGSVWVLILLLNHLFVGSGGGLFSSFSIWRISESRWLRGALISKGLTKVLTLLTRKRTGLIFSGAIFSTRGLVVRHSSCMFSWLGSVISIIGDQRIFPVSVSGTCGSIFLPVLFTGLLVNGLVFRLSFLLSDIFIEVALSLFRLLDRFQVGFEKVKKSVY